MLLAKIFLDLHLPETQYFSKEYPFSARSIGEGIVRWKEIFKLCETSGETEWYIVEYETPGISLWESVKLCLENLRKMGK
jgi:sugar phosphate isomerase/epimerase